MSAIEQLSWPHLLYINGDGVDYEAVDKIVSACDAFPLGPHCWIVRRIPDRDRLANQIEGTFPKESQKAEFLLAPISRLRCVAVQQGGYGLLKWLDKRNEAH
jgi:hypothetical protein